ncbi:MAG: flavodoxin family protein [Candidatus Aminicenantales bacterium]
MNALILNGAPGNGRGATVRAIVGTITAEAQANGWTTSVFDLDGLDIKPCRGCFACWLKHPGICAIKDDEEPILKAMASTDVLVWTTPVTFGGYGPTLKKALDRLIPNLLPFFIKTHGELHHPQRYPRRRSFLVFGTTASPDADVERIFHGLVQRNALNLNSVMTASRVFPEGAAPADWTGTVGKLLADAKEAL